MNNLHPSRTCPKCGALVPADAPSGLCPKCVLANALSPTTPDSRASNSHRGTPPTKDQVAASFPQLEIIELIGAGGMGAVFKARQPKLERLVALKVLPEDLGRDPAFAERFSREARVLARLNHPGIVTVYDFGQADGFFYLLMEYVDGMNLRQAMAAGRFSPTEALRIVPKVCEALQFAHDAGVLHRDIKPENILLDDRARVKIADFGIAKLVGQGTGDAALTALGVAVGTPLYMAPEQLERPAEVDQRADIYSLGVVFYEMLTGELPMGRFAPPSEKSTVDPRVDPVVLRALERDRDKRFNTATEVKSQVEHVTSTPATAAPPPLSSPIPPPPVRLIRQSGAHLTTDAHRRSFLGQWFWIYNTRGNLRLDTTQLTFEARGQKLTIPLAQITCVRLGEFSRLAKPLNLQYLEVTYGRDGQPQTLCFTPNLGTRVSRSDSNESVAEWHELLKQAVTDATGRPPSDVLPEASSRGTSHDWVSAALGLLLVLSIPVSILWAYRQNGTAAMVSLAVLAIACAGGTILWNKLQFDGACRRAAGRGTTGARPPLIPPPAIASKPVSTSRKAIVGSFFAVPSLILGVLWLLALVPSAMVLLPAVANGESAHRSITLLGAVLFASLTALWLGLGLTASVLGLSASSDIRRSQGQLGGAGLATFALTACPLFLLSALVGIAAFVGLMMLPLMLLPMPLALFVLPAALGALLTVVVVDWFLVRRLRRWHEGLYSSGSRARPGARSAGLLAVTVVTVLILLLLGALLIPAAFFTIGHSTTAPVPAGSPGAGFVSSSPVEGPSGPAWRNGAPEINLPFTLPAGQVATFTLVVSNSSGLRTVPLLQGYVMSSDDTPFEGNAQWGSLSDLDQQELNYWGIRLTDSNRESSSISGNALGNWTFSAPPANAPLALAAGSLHTVPVAVRTAPDGSESGSSSEELFVRVQTLERDHPANKSFRKTGASLGVGGTNWVEQLQP